MITDTLLLYASFRTIPDNIQHIKIVCSHKGRVDHTVPSEVDLWAVIRNKLDFHEINMNPQQRHSTSNISLSSNSVIDNIQESPPPIHMIVHHGDFLSINDILHSHIASLLDNILRPESDVSSWYNILQEVEGMIRNAYRKAFCDENIRKILRSCGNVFIAGGGEAGSEVAAMLVRSSVSTTLVEESNRPSTSSGNSNFKTELGVNTHISSAIVTTNNNEGSSLTMMGEEVKKRRAARAVVIEEANTLQNDLQLLLMAALVRIARRVYWTYMRQLWDFPYNTSEDTPVINPNLLNMSSEQRRGNGRGGDKEGGIFMGEKEGVLPPTGRRESGQVQFGDEGITYHDLCLEEDFQAEQRLMEVRRVGSVVTGK